MTDGPGAEPPVALPDAVRERVVALASDALGSLPPDDVPAPLRAVARFTPAKRARLAAGGLAAALETDAVFRSATAALARTREPALAAAVADGVPLPAAPPEMVGALAYLLRPAGWAGRLAAAGEELAARAAEATAVQAVERLQAELAAVRERTAAQVEALQQERDAARAEADAVREQLQQARRRVRELGERAARAEQSVAAPTVPDVVRDDGEPAELRRLRARVAELEAALTAARQASRAAAREDRHAADVRLRVLVDTLVRTATGLRRELAVPPVDELPADAVAAERTGAVAAPPHRGREVDDPALLDALLAAPGAHLLVDGYNVTKTGYGEQTLEVQRSRLLASLGALAARTQAEVTVVFDGAETPGSLAPATPRKVRLLFSRPGETADDVLRALVRAEPAGRPLVVVTSDRAIVEDVRADGARTAPSTALLRLLAR